MWFQTVGDPALHCPVAPGVDVQDQSVPCNAYTTPLTDFTGNRLLSHFGGLSIEYPFDVTIHTLTVWNITQDWALNLGRIDGGHSATLTGVHVFPGQSGRYMVAIKANLQHFAATDLIVIGALAGALDVHQPGRYPMPGEPVTFSIDGGDLRGHSTAFRHVLNWGDLYPSNAAGNTPTTILLNNVGLSGDAGRIFADAPYQDGLNANVPYTFNVTNYEHVNGYNFRLYPAMSAPDAIMPPTAIDTTWQPPTGRAFFNSIGAPVAGLTNAQSLAQFGLAFLGAIAPCSTAEPGVWPAFACGGPSIVIPDPPGFAPPPPPPVVTPPPPPPPPLVSPRRRAVR